MKRSYLVNDTLYLKLRPARVKTWELDEQYSIGIEDEDVESGSSVTTWLRLPAGTTTDFASVPWFGRWLIPQVGRNTIGSIVHDALYRQPKLRDELKLNRADADRLLYDLSRLHGMLWLRARLMWLAVRVGAKGSWRV